jgi:uncharacterized protein (TIGR02246 family)
MTSTGYPTTTTVTAGRAADVEALRELFARMADAWDRADAQAYGGVFTEDADYVIYTGTRYRGRRKIADSHDALWKRYLKGSRLLGIIDDIRFPAPDVAILITRGGILRHRFSRRRANKVQTLVAVRQDGGWRFTAFQNTARKPVFEWISSYTEPRLASNT